MRILRVSEHDIRHAVALANLHYEGNLEVDNLEPITQDGKSFQVKLRVKSSRGAGAHHSAPNGWRDGRRTVALCWHAYRDVLTELFSLKPDAKVRTAMARYDGMTGFIDRYPETYFAQAGSVMYPSTYGTLCECHDREGW